MTQIAQRLNSVADWSFKITAKKPDGTAFDLSAYDIEAQFRTSPTASLIDDCTTGNSKIVRDPQNSNVVTIISLGTGRAWTPRTPTLVYTDVIGKFGQNTIDVASISFYVDPSVTHS